MTTKPHHDRVQFLNSMKWRSGNIKLMWPNCGKYRKFQKDGND